MLNKLSIKQKNQTLVGLVVLVIVATGYLSLTLTVDSVSLERRLMAKNMTELAHSILQRNYDQFSAGQVTEEEAKANAIKTLRPMTYGDSGYFFVYTRSGTVVMHPPKPAAEGINKIDLVDPNGLYVIRELAKVSANGKGDFVSYFWRKPGEETPSPKVSYAIGFEPWDYFIGTGNYESDVYTQVVELVKRKAAIVVFSLLIFSALILAIRALSKTTLTQIISIKRQMEYFADGDFSQNMSISGNDEFAQMRQAMQKVQLNMRSTLSELGNTIDSAKEGDLSIRVSLNDKKGFYKNISQSVNELIGISEQVVGDTSRIFSAMSEGNLSERIDHSYQGAFNQLKVDANSTMEKLNRIINVELQSLVQGACDGNLSGRISLEDKTGFYLTLSKDLNTLIESLESVFSEMGVVLEAMSNGDLSQSVTTDYKGCFDELKQNTNQTISTINETIRNLLSVGDVLSGGADKIESGNNDLSNRTQAQAASLEETAASLEEISATVKFNANNTKQADKLANSARNCAERGDIVVGQAITAMNDINSSSRKISEIISVIDELAFQTNLLALNASVEAARAGEQGRGFAVVADEVRNLAGRSAIAANEIKELIEDSSAKVDVGFKLVNETGSTLKEILGSVKEVEEVIGQITLKGEEQLAGIEHVNHAISSLDDATQKNAALAQHASTAASEMKSSTEEMREIVGFFQANNSGYQDNNPRRRVA